MHIAVDQRRGHRVEEQLAWLDWDQLANPFEFVPTDQGDLPGSLTQIRVARGAGTQIEILGTGTVEPPAEQMHAEVRMGEEIPPAKRIRGSTMSGAEMTLDGARGQDHGIRNQKDF